MRIAYLVNQYPKISHSFIRREIDGLERSGLEVERISIRRTMEPLADPRDRAEIDRTRVLLDGGLARLAWESLVTLWTRPVRFARALSLAIRQGRRSRRGLLLHLAYLAEACVLRRSLAQTRVEHLHAHFATNSATVAALCESLGGPRYSFTFHGPEFFEFPKHEALAEKIARASFTVAISHNGRSQLLRISDRRHWERIHLVHCGVDAEFLDRPSTPIPDRPRFVCVARLDPAKGITILVEAAARLLREGHEFEIVVVGDGEMRTFLDCVIREHGLERHVRLVGWKAQAEVVEEILAARALVLPSFEEGLPVVFMEALALERPVVSTFIAGIPELVVPDVTGWLVPASDVEALAAAMVKVLEATPAQLQAMGRRGAAMVRERHDAIHEARHMAELFTAGAEVVRPNRVEPRGSTSPVRPAHVETR